MMADSQLPSGKNTPAVLSNPSGKKSRTDGNASRHSGKVTFPQNSLRSEAIEEEDKNPKANPFRMPPNNDIFMLRDKERQRKKAERIKQRSLKVHEKLTYATKINFKTSEMIRPADSDEELQKSDEDDGRAVAVKDDPQFTLAVTRDRHVEKESLADYINKKREMFLVQYSLGVKRDEMRKLEEIAAAEEKKLEMAEQYLEEDAAMFDEFLKQNDQNSVDAIRAAEQETKAKLEKVAEIKRINAQMMGVKSEISKYEDTLKEYQLYKKFLEALTPKPWLEKKNEEREQRREAKRAKREAEMRDRKGPTPDLPTDRSGAASKAKKKPMGSRGGALSRGNTTASKGGKETAVNTVRGYQRFKHGRTKNSQADIESEGSGDIDSVYSLNALDSEEESDEEPELFFSDPHQLLDIFAELEEQNLSLIQNSQETEEALEEMKQTIKNTQIKMDKETQILKDQIDKLNAQIVREEAKAKDLEIKARMFSYGEFKAEDQEKMLASLNRKVETVYRVCIGDNEANISGIGTLQMLTNIENRLEELFEQIEMMPQDKVEAAEKAKEKERRLKMREEKMEQQRLHQEERVRKALERAQADPKKKFGRKVVGRSEPPRLRRKEDDGEDQRTREEEELAYFFTE